MTADEVLGTISVSPIHPLTFFSLSGEAFKKRKKEK
jgi:hypothetical protein